MSDQLVPGQRVFDKTRQMHGTVRGVYLAVDVQLDGYTGTVRVPVEMLEVEDEPDVPT